MYPAVAYGKQVYSIAAIPYDDLAWSGSTQSRNPSQQIARTPNHSASFVTLPRWTWLFLKSPDIDIPASIHACLPILLFYFFVYTCHAYTNWIYVFLNQCPLMSTFQYPLPLASSLLIHAHITTTTTTNLVVRCFGWYGPNTIGLCFLVIWTYLFCSCI